jgi:hypothetical protein
VTPIESARAVADAVLYEGYVLYPYRASSSRNQVRWQWGVLMPADVVERDGSERGSAGTEILVDGADARATVTVRFLQVQRRTVERSEGDGFVPVDRLETEAAAHVAWDEARECEVELVVPPTGGEHEVDVDGGTDVEPVVDESGSTVGRLVRVREPLRLGVVTEVRRPTSPYAVSVLALRVENRTPPTDRKDERRPEWLRRALVACHVLVTVEAGRFLSLLEPPEWAGPLAAACRHEGLFPVLGGPSGQESVMLASPIILYDHPEIAPESATAFFDALEVDELLSLRTATLTEDERREVRGTDPRAARLLDDVDSLPTEIWDRLHGTIRHLDAMTGAGPPPDEGVQPETPWWDPGADATVDPEHDAVAVAGVEVRRGSRVILRPGVRRADAYDMFLAGRTATVAAVLSDVDQGTHLAVTVDDDPGSDLKESHGRYLYFSPDEVEPLLAGAEGSVR